MHLPLRGAVAPLTLPGKVPSPLLNGLLAHWALEEASGSRLDSSGHSETLTDVNTVTQNPGKIGNAGQFTLANVEYLTRLHGGTLNITHGSEFSACGWMYGDTIAGNHCPIGNGNASNFQYELRVFTNSGVLWTVRTSGGNKAVNINQAFTNATWYFWYVQYDPTNDRVSISINAGSLAHTSLAGATVSTNTTPTFAIGAFVSGGLFQRQWNGRLDETGIRSRILTTTEITQLYNSGNGLAYPFS